MKKILEASKPENFLDYMCEPLCVSLNSRSFYGFTTQGEIEQFGEIDHYVETELIVFGKSIGLA